MSYNTLVKEEERLFSDLASDMFSFTSEKLKKEGPLGYLASGLVEIGSIVIKGQAKDKARRGIVFFLEKVKESIEGSYEIETVVDDFQSKFYAPKLGKKDLKTCKELVKLESERYEKLMKAGGESYEELFRNAYSDKEEALKDLEAVYEKEKEFFDSATLPRWFVSKKFMRSLALGSIEMRKKIYEEIITRAFTARPG